MVDDNALSGFITTTLNPILKVADAERRRRLNTIGLVLLVAIVAVALVWVLVSGVAAFFAGLGGIFVVAIVVGLSKDAYSIGYKSEVLSLLAPFMQPGVNFAGEEDLPFEILSASSLFESKKAGKYRCHDLFKGTVGQTRVYMADVLVQEVERRHGKNGRHYYKHHTLLEGLVVAVELEPPVSGTTLVLPDVAERLLGSFVGGLLQRALPEIGERVQMPDRDFEKQFVVYSTNPDEARRLLTPTLTQQLTLLRSNRRQKVLLSASDGYLVSVFAQTSDSLKPSLFRSALKSRLVEQAVERVRLLQQVVELVANRQGRSFE